MNLTRRLITAATIQQIAQTQAPAKPQPAPEPENLYEPDEMPDLADIETAAAKYDQAADQRRQADRANRAAKKIIGRLPAGIYGTWLVERIRSNRQTADLDKIRATYARYGLGPVPMRDTAPSPKVTRVAAVIPTDQAPASDDPISIAA